MPIIIWSQSKDSLRAGTILGVVKDSANNYGLQSVTITVYQKKDSTLLDYQLSNPLGEFNFTTIPFYTPVIVNFSFTGYSPFSKTIQLDSAARKYDFKTILLSRSSGMMDEVVVQAVLPIRMNGDTLEINPAAFKLDSNAVVEDMLRRVPGVTLWGDGTITVNGKTVNKVFVDGKPFFGGDPAIATQNLPKNAIEKIQVYQEQDYSKDNIDENPTDSLLTMNIKLREDKKFGFFGKAGAGIGTDDRYEADLSLQAFNKKNRFGIAGALNNINKSGDINSIFKQSTYRNFRPSNRYVADFGGSGINKIGYLGATYQYDFLETRRGRLNNQLNANYDLRQNINDVSSQTSSQSSIDGAVLLGESQRESHSESQTHTIGTSYNKRDRSKDFSINANFNSSNNSSLSNTFANTEKLDVGLISTNNQQSVSEGATNNFSFGTSFRNNDDDERNLKSFNISYNANYNDNDNERHTLTDFNSFTDPTDSRYFNRRYNNHSSGFSNNLSVGYNALKRLLFGGHNLWDINISVSNNLSVSRSKSSTLTSDYDTLTSIYHTNESLTYYNNLTRIEDRPTLRFSKNFRKNLSDRYARYINLSATLQGQFLTEKNESDINRRNNDRSFSFFLPGLSASYNYEKYNKYRITMDLSQNNSAGIPSIEQLFPIIDSSQSSFNNGNADLKPYYTNSLNYSINYQSRGNGDKGDFNFSLNIRAGQTKNGITDSTNYDESFRRVVYLINIKNGRKYYNAELGINKSFKLKKDILQFGYTGSFNNNYTPNYVRDIFSTSENHNVTNNLKVFYSIGELATLEFTQGININNSINPTNKIPSLTNTTYLTNASINLKFPKDVTWGTTMDYVNNKTASQTAALWNAFLTYRFLKNKAAEVKLSAMDLLRQNKNITVNTGLNSLNTTVTNGLQQFYMITFSYYPRRFGKASGRGREGFSGERVRASGGMRPAGGNRGGGGRSGRF